MQKHGSLTFVWSLAFATAALAVDAPTKKSAALAATAPPATAPASPGTALPETVAIVEGDPIKKAELEAAFDSVVAAQKIPIETLAPDDRASGYRLILDDMIINKLLLKRAAETKVPEEEVTAQFEKLKADFGSDEDLKKQLDAAGQTLEKVKIGMRERLRQEHWMNEQIKGKAEVTDADAADFYQKNPEQFQAPEQVRASHILIAIPEDAKPEFVVEKEKVAQAVAARVKKGEPFDKLAQELSEDPSAKQNSGDLDFFTREAMVPEFSTKAFSMKKDEISEPVRSKFGYHVIKVTDRKDAETMALEKAKPQLLTFLQRQKKQTEIEKVVKELRAKAEVQVNLPPAPAPAPALAP